MLDGSIVDISNYSEIEKRAWLSMNKDAVLIKEEISKKPGKETGPTVEVIAEGPKDTESKLETGSSELPIEIDTEFDTEFDDGELDGIFLKFEGPESKIKKIIGADAFNDTGREGAWGEFVNETVDKDAYAQGAGYITPEKRAKIAESIGGLTYPSSNLDGLPNFITENVANGQTIVYIEGDRDGLNYNDSKRVLIDQQAKMKAFEAQSKEGIYGAAKAFKRAQDKFYKSYDAHLDKYNTFQDGVIFIEKNKLANERAVAFGKKLWQDAVKTEGREEATKKAVQASKNFLDDEGKEAYALEQKIINLDKSSPDYEENKKKLEKSKEELQGAPRFYDVTTGTSTLEAEKATPEAVGINDEAEDLAANNTKAQLEEIVAIGEKRIVGLVLDFADLIKNNKLDEQKSLVPFPFTGASSTKTSNYRKEGEPELQFNKKIQHILDTGELPKNGLKSLVDLFTSAESEYGKVYKTARLTSKTLKNEFDTVLKDYLVASTALNTNVNILLDDDKELASEFIESVGNSFNIDVFSDSDTKSEKQGRLVNMFSERTGTFDMDKLESLRRKNSSTTWQQDVLIGFPELVKFIGELYVFRTLSFGQIARLGRVQKSMGASIFEGNTAAIKANNIVANIFVESSEFAGAAAMSNQFGFGEEQDVLQSAKSGGYLSFGGVLGRQFFKFGRQALSKTGLDSKLTNFSFIQRTGEMGLVKRFYQNSQAAIGGSTAVVASSILMDPEDYEWSETAEVMAVEFFKLLALGYARGPMNYNRAYETMGNDLLSFKKRTLSSSKGTKILNLPENHTDSPNKDSNKITKEAKEKEYNKIKDQVKKGEITREEAAVKFKNITEAAKAVNSQIMLNQARESVEASIKAGETLSSGQQYLLGKKIKNSPNDITVEDVNNISKMTPEGLLISVGEVVNKNSLKKAKEFIESQKIAIKLLDGGGYITTTGGFKATGGFAGEFRAKSKPLRKETLKFLQERSDASQVLEELKEVDKKNLNPIELAELDRQIASAKNKFSKYEGTYVYDVESKLKKYIGGEKYKNLQIKLQDEAIAEFDKDVSREKESDKAKNIKGEQVVINDIVSFQKKYNQVIGDGRDVGGKIAFTDQITGDRYINKNKALEVRNTESGNHERIHAFLIDSLKDVNGRITDEGIKVIDNIIDGLSPSEKVLLSEELKGRGYKGKMSRDKKGYYEENLTIIGEFADNNKLSNPKELGKRLIMLVPALRRKYFKNLKVDESTGEGMLEMIKGFSKYKEGVIAADKFAKNAQTKPEIKKAKGAAFSSSRAELQDKLEKLREEEFSMEEQDFKAQESNLEFKIRAAEKKIDKNPSTNKSKAKVKQDTKRLGLAINKLIPEGTTKAKYDNDVIKQVSADLIVGEKLNPLIRKIASGYGITADNVYQKSWNDFYVAVKNPQFVRNLKKFNPEENNDFGGYVIGSQFGIRNRVKEALNEFKKLAEGGIKQDISTANKIAENTSSETTKDVKLIKATKILNAEQLARAKKIVADMSIDYENLSYKKLKGVTREITSELTGIPENKIGFPAKNLSQGQTTTAAMFISNNIEYIRNTLPEGAVLKGASEKLIGTSTGLPEKMLKAFYVKNKRGDNLFPYILRKNLTSNEILEEIGRPRGGKPVPIDPRTPRGTIIKAIIDTVDKNITNELVRTEKDLTPQQRVDAGAGKGRAVFSEELIRQNFQNNKLIPAFIKGLESKRFKEILKTYTSKPEEKRPWLRAATEYFTGENSLDMKSNLQRKVILQTSDLLGMKGPGEVSVRRQITDRGFEEAVKVINDFTKNNLKKGNFSYNGIDLAIGGEITKADLSTKEGINKGRLALKELINSLAAKGFIDKDIKQLVYGAFITPAGLGKYSGGKTPKGISLTDAELGEKKKNSRGGLIRNVEDYDKNFKSNQLSLELGLKEQKITKNTYVKDYWTDFKSKFKFNLMNSNEKQKFLIELNKEGERNEKQLLQVIETIKDLRIEDSSKRLLNTQLFAGMSALGKRTSTVKYVLTNKDGKIFSFKELEKLGLTKPGDKGVFEHTKPAKRISLASYSYIKTGDPRFLKILKQELKTFDSALITEKMDASLRDLKLQSTMGLDYKPTSDPMVTRYKEMVQSLSEKGVYFKNILTDKLITPLDVLSEIDGVKEIDKKDIPSLEKYKAISEQEVKLAESKVKASFSNNKTMPSIIKYDKPISIKTGIDALRKTDKALDIARDKSAPVKKIRVFDFDDTLAKSKSKVLVTMPGEKVVYNASPKTFDQLGKRTGLIFLATDMKEAQEYAKSNRGEVKTISVNESRLATENQVLDKMKSLNINTSEGLLYEMIDSRFENFYIGNENLNKLKEALKQSGFGGFKYNDGSQISSKGTESIAVIDKSIIKESTKINATEFAEKSEVLTSEGAKFDFSEFSKVMDGKKGPLFEVAKIIADKRGTDDVFVLTARPAEAAGPIQEFLKSLGLNIPLKNITGLGDGTSEAKAGWVIGKASEGYNDFYFADDAIKNVKGVKDALSVLDVKSKVQLAKVAFSESMDVTFNKIIENKTGIAAEKNFAKVKARLAGAKKGRFNFFIPPSAEDFVGLLYKTLGKGEVGNQQFDFYKKSLFNPYARAMTNITVDRRALYSNFDALKKELKIIPKNLKKKVGDTDFTREQAVRVYMWDKAGKEIPGLSKSDFKQLKDMVKNSAELTVFADQVIALNKGAEVSNPKSDWITGTMTTDMLENLNTIKRKEYLAEWQQNVDVIFSEKNLNKMEAAYGEPYRKALENMLGRMKTGRNRTFTEDSTGGRLTDWINGSTGAIMFFNSKSAVLQTISAANFIDFKDNNIFAAGKAFANQPQYWKDFLMLYNSDYLVERRDGLKININEADIANIAKENGARGVVNKLLKLGFTPTQVADSFAIASGGSTFYRTKVKALMKQQAVDKELTKKNRKITYGNKYTIEQAEKIAMIEFRERAEESQQSSRPDKISMEQAGPLGRVVLAFANTPAQYARIIKKSASDLKNGRGDAKANISKIMYYGVAQNIMFNSLQQALFSVAFGDEEENLSNEDYDKNLARKNEKTIRIANGMADSILRGTGIGGAIFSVVKNAAMKIYSESEKKNPEYETVALELLKISPPVSSKVSKIMSAGRSFSWNTEEMKAKGFSLDNPAYLAAGNTVSALTNIPLDRVVKKMQHIKASSDAELESYKRIALLLGWSEWDLGIEKEKFVKSKRRTRGRKGKFGI